MLVMMFPTSAFAYESEDYEIALDTDYDDYEDVLEYSTDEVFTDKGGISAWADVDQIVITVEGSVICEEDGIWASVYDDATITIQTGEVQTGWEGVELDAYSGGTINAVTGDMDAGEDYAVFVEAEEGGTVTLTTGDLSCESGYGIHVDAESEAQVSVEAGDVEASSYGVSVEAYDGSTVDITTGDVGFGEEGTFPGISTSNVDSTVTIQTGDVTWSGTDLENMGVAITTATYYDGETTIAAGDISAAAGVMSRTYGGETTVTAGDVTAIYVGVEADSIQGGTTEVTVGDVTCEKYGIVVEADWSNDFDDTAPEAPEPTYSVDAAGTEPDGEGDNNFDYENNPTTVTVTAGDVNAAKGVIASVTASNCTVQVKAENVTGEELGVEANSAWTSSEVSIEVNGDLTATEGVALWVESEEGGLVDVLVAGTIDGEVSSIVCSNAVAEDISITAWKIELDENDHVVADISRGLANSTPSYDEYTEEIEQNIQYIIKVEQPTSGARVSASDEFGNPLARSHEHDVAQENEKVILNIDLEDGYEVTGAYNGQGEKQPLLQDADGNYYVLVPRGGVYLTVELGEVTPEEPEQPETPEEPENPETPEEPENPEEPEEPEPSDQQEAKVLLVIHDEEENITITFFDNFTYKAEQKDGSAERGRFQLQDGKIVLVDAKGNENVINDKGELKYLFGGDDEQTYELQLKDDEMTILFNALK